MRVATAKELKNRTGEALRRVARGERLLILRRGKPVAVLAPATDPLARDEVLLRPPDVAWADIEARLKGTPPAFATWKEALRWSRRRA